MENSYRAVSSSTLSRMTEDDESFFGRDDNSSNDQSPIIRVDCDIGTHCDNMKASNHDKNMKTGRFEMQIAQCSSYFPSDFFGDRMEQSHTSWENVQSWWLGDKLKPIKSGELWISPQWWSSGDPGLTFGKKQGLQAQMRESCRTSRCASPLKYDFHRWNDKVIINEPMEDSPEELRPSNRLLWAQLKALKKAGPNSLSTSQFEAIARWSNSWETGFKS